MARTAQPARAIPPLLKHLNERTVLETIRARAPISRAEISRLAGISKPTVSLALQSLLDAGLVRETSAEVGRPSYGAVFFEPVPDAAFVLGLDLGARSVGGSLAGTTARPARSTGRYRGSPRTSTRPPKASPVGSRASPKTERGRPRWLRWSTRARCSARRGAAIDWLAPWSTRSPAG